VLAPFDDFKPKLYNFSVVLPPDSRKEVVQLDILTSFIVSIVASIVAYYICKWLDRNK